MCLCSGSPFKFKLNHWDRKQQLYILNRQKEGFAAKAEIQEGSRVLGVNGKVTKWKTSSSTSKVWFANLLERKCFKVFRVP